MRDAVKQGRMTRGTSGTTVSTKKKTRAILREYIAEKAIELINSGKSGVEVSEITNLSQTAISRLKNGNRRKYLIDKVK